ncbi:MAG: hypothetical protein IH945_01540 [Armatimonadetes bacterium]|nr:hypothetical protein [Armatimonadota bacterium]
MTVVLTLVVLLLGVNMSQYLRDPNRIREQKVPDVPAEEEKRAPEDLPDDVQIGVVEEASGLRMAGGRGQQVPLGEIPDDPSILLPRLQRYPTQYQIDTTSAQWWRENSKQ